MNNKKRNGELLDVMLIYLLMPFSSESNDPAKKVSLYFGVIVEFIFLCGFLYASISYFADYFALLDPAFITPSALQNYGIRFMFSAIGVTLYLGLVFFDIQGVNKFFGKKFENKKMAGFIITATLLLQIVLEIMIGASRYRLMVSSPEVLATLETISNIGISLIAIPLLISTSLAARGIYAIALFLAFIVYVVKIFFVRSSNE